MQISFEALEKALAPIKDIGQGELTFPVGGVDITLQVLTPEQEVDVQRYAGEAIQGDEDENISTTADYLERFKVAVLSHAIIAVGDQDLRDVDVVETDEKLPNGQSVKLPKVQALRKMLLQWTGTVRISIFRKYGELLEKVERRAESAITFEPADLGTEIERVEQRLKTLQEEKKKQGKDAEDGVSSQVAKLAKSLARQGVQDQAEYREHVDQAAAARVGVTSEEGAEVPPEAPAPSESPVPRQSILPPSAPPPGAVKPNVAVPPPEPTPPPETAPDVARAPEPLPEEDSFVDAGDSEAMDAAVDAENRRLIEIRRRAIEQHRAGEVPQQPHGMRPPPHRAAQDVPSTDYNPEDFDDSQLKVSKAPDGAPAVQMQPTEELSQTKGSRGGRVPLNQAAAPKGSGNPRFKPPQK